MKTRALLMWHPEDASTIITHTLKHASWIGKKKQDLVVQMSESCEGLVNGSWGGLWSWRNPPRGRALDNLASLVSLIGNPCPCGGWRTWIIRCGLTMLRAPPRFQRPPLNKAQHVKGANVGQKSFGVSSNSKVFSVSQSSYAGAVKNDGEHKQVSEMDSKPSLVIDESCMLEYDYSLALKGKVADFGLLTNLKTVLSTEGFERFNITYLGGFWVLIEFCTMELLEKFKSHVGVGSWFSSLDKRICIKTKMEQNIFETFKIIIKGKVFSIRAKEVSGWIPDFLDEDEEDEEDDDVVEVQENIQKSNKQDNFTKDNNVKGVTHSKEEDKESFCSGQFRRSVCPLTGGILCAWDPKMFHKHNVTISDYFVAIQGEWIANAKKYLFISVYASQEASEKRMLWSYLNYMIDRDKKSATMKKAQLKGMLQDIDILIDEKKVDEELLNKRMNVINSIQDLEKLEVAEIAQKAKIKWSIEGDENSIFFHGILNKKRNQHAIRGILSEGNFPKGGNSSFIALIPKMHDAKVAKDYRPISLIGSLYKIIAKILANRLVRVLRVLVNEVQSAFIVNRKILDGPFILDELIHWCHAKKKETMIFKVDFEKAYDSVIWDYLDDVLNKFWFGSKWRNWIHKCLNSSKGSIQVNGSPTGEFQFRKGLKQVGGSMSRMKAWDEIEAKLHSCLSKWKMKTLLSGGRLTLLKSVLGSSPIYYMSIYKVPSKVLKCLEDIRRSFFIGADVKEKKMSWFNGSRVLASKDKGGLGVSSFFALNRALLFKWMWRFFNDKDALWSRFIRAVHDNSGGIETHSRVSYSSTWLSIVNEVNKMRNTGIDLLKYMKIQNLTVADKMAHKDNAFSLRRQPRDGVEMEQFRALSMVIEGVLLHDMVDRWKWTLEGSGEFSVASARKFIDNSRLIGSPKKTQWIKMVPIKFNILA
nr:RNA-directed DNA polymerase, eukaryota, reverse transcriptase zinc-binding domain protein [Tanacetum cinerariifolium]